ncbi:hypothetical protein [Roseicitreum antarcticum]|uniref:Uncharacterized protein n=1 Tax=Roseicitreum antarcticum TaxID=564137 RepID=A0A1H3E5S9_9RHOB|nr:hypothetical protein [Roseicitreum antarcticum]SDX74025.1 hypothetical protein SAMN04488238_11820 [Roseicitreum antarcticum]
MPNLTERRLFEALGILIGDRGNDGRRALRVDEFDRLFGPANAQTMREIQRVSETVTETGVTVEGVLVDIANLNTTADNIIAEVNAFTTSIQTDFDALLVDVDGANAAALQAQAARDAAIAEAANALASANSAGNSQTQSAASATAAGLSEASAANAAATAATSQTNAENAATASAASAATADTRATDADQSATAAQASRTAAETARSGAESAETNAATSATNAEASSAQASSSATNAATSANSAGDSATASASSASAAQTSASDASQSATAASDSEIAAQTEASAAGVARSQAVTASENADAAAALAGERLTVTSQITSRGISVLRDQFLAEFNAANWTRDNAQGELTLVDNTLYSIGQDWRFVTDLGEVDGLQTRSDRANWRGPRNAERYVVDVDFTLESGSIAGACVYLDWVNSASTVSRVEVPLSMSSSGPVVTGQPMTATMLIERPSDFAGVFDYNRLIVYANRNTLVSGNAEKTIRFHRISIRPANDAEARVIDIAASVTQEALTRANDDAALATQISTVQSDLGDVSAEVSTQATAISTIEGNAAATLAFRAEAGSAGATLELIAASDPTGTTSMARIDAANIILNGSVTAAQLSTGLLITDTAQIGDAVITGANIGEAEITTANIADATITSAKIAGGIESDNYTPGPDGSGWAIYRSGFAQFGTLSLREGAVTTIGSVQRASYDTTSVWVDILSVDIPAFSGATLTAIVSGLMTQTSRQNSEGDVFYAYGSYRVVINGTVRFTRSAESGPGTGVFAVPSLTSGDNTITVQGSYTGDNSTLFKPEILELSIVGILSKR